MNVSRSLLMSLIDGLIDDVKGGTLRLPFFDRRTEERDIWFELSFCISSSQDRVRRAAAAARALTQAFDELAGADDVLGTVRSILEREFITLRFMNKKSEQIAGSWKQFRRLSKNLIAIEDHFDSPAAARDFLVSTFPGIGQKQASMLLRNIGWGSDLAIVDSHILRISSMILDEPANASDYLGLERQLRQFAVDRGVTLENLDVILWSCSRMLASPRATEGMLV